MKTTLPLSIKTVEEAKAFLTALHANGEDYHPEDNAINIEWNAHGADAPDYIQLRQLNKLMSDIYCLPGNDGRHSAPMVFDPCEFLLSLDGNITEPQIIKGAKFYTKVGIIEIIEVMPNYFENLTGVKSTIDGKGDSMGAPYCDEISELLDFINENLKDDE